MTQLAIIGLWLCANVARRLFRIGFTITLFREWSIYTNVV